MGFVGTVLTATPCNDKKYGCQFVGEVVVETTGGATGRRGMISGAFPSLCGKLTAIAEAFVANVAAREMFFVK